MDEGRERSEGYGNDLFIYLVKKMIYILHTCSMIPLDFVLPQHWHKKKPKTYLCTVLRIVIGYCMYLHT